MPDRIRNAVVKLERRSDHLPPPLRQVGQGTAKLFDRALGSITAVSIDEPLVGLTFDDGPDPVITPAVLDILGERGARATFFMLSERAEEHPELARRVVAEGHEVALHGANHDNLTRLGTRQVMDRVHGGRDRLSAVVGAPVRLFRPPYGAQTVASHFLSRLWGLKVVMWSVDPHDWDDTGTDEIVSRAVGRSSPGAIMLLHDAWSPTPSRKAPVSLVQKPKVVTAIVEGLAEAGLRASSVGEMLSTGTAHKRVWFSSG